VPWMYALLMRSYPKSWQRNRRTDEVLAIMLDSAEADGRRRPRVREAVDVVGHGLGVRLRSLDETLPADVRVAVVQLTLVVSTAFVMFCLVFGELRIPWISDGEVPADLTLGMNPQGHPFMTLGAFVYLGWIAMFGLYMFGRMRQYRELATVTFLLTCLLPTIAGVAGQQRPPGTLLLMLSLLNVLALLPGRETCGSARTRLAMAVGATVALAGLVAVRLYTYHQISMDFHGPERVQRMHVATARWGFYWLCEGTVGPYNFGAPDLAQLVAPYGLAAALFLSVLARRWNRHWLPAVAIVSVPFVVLRVIYTGRPGTYGHLGLNVSRALLQALLWALAAVIIVLSQSPLIHRLATRIAPRQGGPRADRQTFPRRPLGGRPRPTG
jgi:hypothetical protein